MVINFEQKLINIAIDQPYKNEDDTDFTLKNACVNAVLANLETEKINGEEKWNRYQLATKIIKGKETDFTIEEVAKIKELVGRAFGVGIVGQVYSLLEGK